MITYFPGQASSWGSHHIEQVHIFVLNPAVSFTSSHFPPASIHIYSGRNFITDSGFRTVQPFQVRVLSASTLMIFPCS